MDQVNVPVRLFFKKEGRACYISHLDLSRVFSRALVRSGLPVWYTQGFNPHLYRTFTLPLSLGVAGKKESCDIKLCESVDFDVVKEKINGALPEGIEVFDVAAPLMDPKEIMWADYLLLLDCDEQEAKKAVVALSKMDEINVDKKTKKGIKAQNIKELYKDLHCETKDCHAFVTLKCRAGVEVNLNPSLILEALKIYQGFEPYFSRIVRTAILTQNLEDFK